MNEHSSRSHTILTVYLNSEQKDFDDPTSYIRKQVQIWCENTVSSILETYELAL